MESYGIVPLVYDLSGNLVKVKWLVDSNNKSVINPSTNKPYLVPESFDLEKFVKYFKAAGQHIHNNLHGNAERTGFIGALLLGFAPGAQFDIQRSYGGIVPGYFEGGNRFVSKFTDVASFLYGLACSAVEIPQNDCLIGGGVTKLITSLTSTQKIGSIKDWFNPTGNANNIREGYEFFNKFNKNNVGVDSLYSGVDESSFINIKTVVFDSQWYKHDFIVQGWFKTGLIANQEKNNWNDWFSNALVNTGGPGINLNNYPTAGPGINLNPIGAYYESRSLANDSALAISSKTFRIINNNGQALSSTASR